MDNDEFERRVEDLERGVVALSKDFEYRREGQRRNDAYPDSAFATVEKRLERMHSELKVLASAAITIKDKRRLNMVRARLEFLESRNLFEKL